VAQVVGHDVGQAGHRAVQRRDARPIPFALHGFAYARLSLPHHAAGASPRIGARLAMILREAGLQNVSTFGVQAYLPPDDPAAAALLAGVVRSLAPVITGRGIATAEQVGVATLEDRIAAELKRADAVLLPPTVVGAWAPNY